MIDNKNAHDRREEIVKKSKELMQSVRQKILIRDYLEELVKKPKTVQELIRERDNISANIEELLRDIKKLVEEMEKLNGKK